MVNIKIEKIKLEPSNTDTLRIKIGDGDITLFGDKIQEDDHIITFFERSSLIGIIYKDGNNIEIL